MTRAEIERDHWVERYLAGRLSTADTERFEAYWSAHPEVIDALEQSARLSEGLRQLDGARQLQALLRPAWWTGRLRIMALAASVACVALAGAILGNLGSIASAPLRIAATVDGLDPIGGVALQPLGQVSVMRLRSTSSVDATVILPLDPAALLVRVMPDTGVVTDAEDESRARFRVSLSPHAAGDTNRPGAVRETLIFEGPLTQGADGFVAFFVDSRGLAPGLYGLVLERADPAARAETRASRFVLRVANDASPP